jgi:2-amino-4-hydroxy-6-hydroxymethyldihydropteridine diphosphokinase
LIRSALPAALLLEALLRVEAELGRVRSVPCAPRTVDLDLLWIEGETVRSSTLEVPHPRLAERAFALRPMVDVAPDARDPSGALYASSPLASAPLRALPR